VFRALFETFAGDEVTLPKIKQQAANLDVHPENTDDCAAVFAASAVMAGLAHASGDAYVFATAADAVVAAGEPSPKETDQLTDGAEQGALEREEENINPPSKARAAVQVTINLDSSLDTEKLEKQLQLLRRYGAL
jgi:hypothetical protein